MSISQKQVFPPDTKRTFVSLEGPAGPAVQDPWDPWDPPSPVGPVGPARLAKVGPVPVHPPARMIPP